MSWVAVAVAGGSIIGGVVQGKGAQKSANADIAARQKAIDDFLGRQDSLLSGAEGNQDIFGRKPEGILFDPVDVTQSQLDTIDGNLRALPGAIDLTDQTNRSIIENDLSRARSLAPNFDQNLEQLGGVTRDLLFGRLPFSDILDISSDRAELSATLGIPGGDAPTTLRDLGLSRLQAMQQGANLFQSMLAGAQNISPVQSQLRPQSQFLDPATRLSTDVLQRQLVTDSLQRAEFLDAAPDPGSAAIFNARLFGNLATIGGNTGGGGAGLGLQGLGQGISSGSQALAQYFQNQQTQQSIAQQNASFQSSQAQPSTIYNIYN